MKYLILALFLVISINLFSQTLGSNVVFEGTKRQIIKTGAEDISAAGKLSTGEDIKLGCDHGACWLRIEYKGRIIEQTFADYYTTATLYEYDFGDDADLELVIVTELEETSYLSVFFYSNGIIKELFFKEIMYYKTVLTSSYIEYYMPSGLDQIWHYYQGEFWEMTPYKTKKS